MFKFSIRDLFWLTLVAAMAAGWWCREQSLATRLSLVEGQQSELKQTVEALEKVLEFDEWGVRRKEGTLQVYPLKERRIGGFVFHINQED